MTTKHTTLDYLAMYHKLCESARKTTHATEALDFNALKKANKAEAESGGVLKQVHHIWPKVLGGDPNASSNICSMTPSEHVTAHLLFNIGMMQRGGGCVSVVKALGYVPHEADYVDIDFFKDKHFKNVRFLVSLTEDRWMSCTGRQVAMFVASGLKLDLNDEKNLKTGFIVACKVACFEQDAPGYSGCRKIKFDFSNK